MSIIETASFLTCRYRRSGAGCPCRDGPLGCSRFRRRNRPYLSNRGSRLFGDFLYRLGFRLSNDGPLKLRGGDNFELRRHLLRNLGFHRLGRFRPWRHLDNSSRFRFSHFFQRLSEWFARGRWGFRCFRIPFGLRFLNRFRIDISYVLLVRLHFSF